MDLTHEAGGVPDVLEAPPPALSADEAAEVAEGVFGLRGSLSPLDGERDQNFRLDSDEGSFVLEISNTAEDPAVVELQTAALAHIAATDPTLPVPRVRPTREGEPFAAVDGHLVHVLTYLDGEMLEPGALGADGLFAFGELTGRTAQALQGFFRAAAGRELLWDVKQAAAVRPLAGHIADPERAALVARALDGFAERALPVLPSLRAQVVHGDFTLTNVVFDAGRNPSGIIDFGDVVHTPLVCDLAVALASVLRGGEEMWATAAPVLAGYQARVVLEDRELDVLPDLVAARLAATVAISAWRVERFPENAEYITSLDEDSWPVLELFDELGPEAVRTHFRAAAARGRFPQETPQLVERRKKAFGPAHAPLSYTRPLHFVRGEGVWMVAADGTRYLDAYNNVPVVGHSHPRVAEAVAGQARLLSTNSRYAHEAAVELAERLAATLPEGVDVCMFVNSGSEANELAWRLASVVAGERGAIVSSWAYHGVTTLTADLSPSDWPAGEHPAWVATVAAPEGSVADAVAQLGSRGYGPAAMFLDAAWTSDGIYTEPADAPARAAEAIREAGGLFVADEVQTGFGRLGSGLWGFEHAGVSPDFVTLGKPMGNGFPVAAVLARTEIAEAFAARRERVFSTFGGNPVAAAAALAVLDVIEEEALVERAARVGALLHTGLREVAERHGVVTDVRGAGLLAGVELGGEPDLGPRVADAVRDRGVLVSVTGPKGNVLKIRPPLPFGAEHVELLLEALDSALGEVATAR